LIVFYNFRILWRTYDVSIYVHELLSISHFCLKYFGITNLQRYKKIKDIIIKLVFCSFILRSMKTTLWCNGWQARLECGRSWVGVPVSSY